MGRPRRDANRGMVVARDAMVVFVGARPPAYETFETVHNKTGQPVTMNKDQPSDPGTEGVPYTFKQYQRAARSHPAVQQSPHLFMDIEELDDAELELVTS